MKKCPICNGEEWEENKTYGTRFCKGCGFVPSVIVHRIDPMPRSNGTPLPRRP